VKHFLLIPVGSHGDVNPFVGLGAALKSRGHRVTVATNGYFEDLVRKEGLEFVELGSRDEFLRMVNHPDLWDPVRSAYLIYREGVVPLLRPMYKMIEQEAVPGETVLVGSILAFGARIAQEKLRLSFASVHLQPAVFRSCIKPPLIPGLHWVRKLPPWAVRGVFRVVDEVVDRMIGPEINRFRGELGLAPAHRFIDQWWHSPQRVIGLFPEWFATPAPDWPKQVKLTHFPLYDGASAEPMPPELETFLSAGPPPIVFTPGSAMSQGVSFFQESLQACERLGCRGLFLTKFPSSVPHRLPPQVRRFGYVPFSHLLPKAAAFVHHGGIGSTSQALAAGIPQLIMPLAHDQPDNADRARKLGVALVLSPQDYKANSVAAVLKELMENPAYKSQALAIRKRFEGVDAQAETCRFLEELPKFP